MTPISRSRAPLWIERFAAPWRWPRLAAVAGLGVAACAACCAAPVALAAVGLGSSALVVSVLATLEPIMAGATLLVVLALGAALLVRRRAGTTARSPSDAAPAREIRDGCGCAERKTSSHAIYRSGDASPDAPIVCTAPLDRTDVQAYMDRYRAVFTRLVARERFAGGFAWVFRDEPGLADELATLASLERSCCSFFRFDLQHDGPERIRWEVRADERAAAVLDEYARLPDRLADEPRPGHDVRGVKRHAEAAGLVFTRG